MFALGLNGKFLVASSAGRNWRFHGTEATEAIVRAFMAEEPADTGTPAIDRLLVGAMPFDRAGEVALFEPDKIQRDVPTTELVRALRTQAAAPKPLSVTEQPAARDYAQSVRKALAMIAAAPEGGLHKIVLARGLSIEMDGPVDPVTIAQRLCGDPSVTVFLASLSANDANKAIVGATPELLLSRRGLNIASHPLAGSMPRSPDAAEDKRAAEALLRSDKDSREHALVTEAVLDTLAPYCARLAAPQGMTLRSTGTVWHLGTRIEGVLKGEDAPTAAGLAALLHPTPAVGGHPREEALAAIRTLEQQDRGYYAGAVGWVDGHGDGDWYVTLRCAQINGRQLLLQAGAGIVAGSDPQSEVVETAAKFRAMLNALGLDDQGRFLEAAA